MPVAGSNGQRRIDGQHQDRHYHAYEDVLIEDYDDRNAKQDGRWTHPQGCKFDGPTPAHLKLLSVLSSVSRLCRFHCSVSLRRTKGTVYASSMLAWICGSAR